MLRVPDKTRTRLTKKQFIIVIVSVCSIALIVEGILLVRMFSKGRKQKNETLSGQELDAGPGIKSYTARTYEMEGGQWLSDCVKEVQVRYDPYGRKTYEYSWEKNRGSVETTFSYAKGKLSAERQTSIRPFHGTEEKEEKAVFYDYYDSAESSTLVKRMFNEKGKVVETDTTKYNQQGLIVSWQYATYSDGQMTGESTGIREYNEFGRCISSKWQRRDYSNEAWNDEEQRIAYLEDSYGVKYIYEVDGAYIRVYRTFLDGFGRILRREYQHKVSKHLYHSYYFYDGPESKACKECRIYELVPVENDLLGRDYVEGDICSVREFDASGRILRDVCYGKKGITTILYRWDAEDNRIPGKKVLQIRIYAGEVSDISSEDNLLSEYWYLTNCKKTVAEDGEPMPEFSCYGGGIVRTEEDVGWYETDRVRFGGVKYDYVGTDGTWTLTEYSAKELDEEKGTWNTLMKSEFDENGNRIHSVQWRDDYVTYSDYDDHGNCIREEETNEATKYGRRIEYEYEYYQQ